MPESASLLTSAPVSVKSSDNNQLPPVQLDAFEGPLDILLHMIRSQEMEIFDIPIAQLTGQYLKILEEQNHLNLDIAGDYLVMASTLMQLKSKLLLPRPELDDQGEEIDPRAELVAQLLAYEQYRLLAEKIGDLPRIGRNVFTRASFPEADLVERAPPEADLDALLVAFRNVLKRVGGKMEHRVFMDTMSVREQMGMVLERLGHGGVSFEDLLLEQPGREPLVTTFLAVLELWREKLLTLVQSNCYDSISLLPIKTSG
ncbi:MAG: segregation and condensation protein A [Mariprofundaceae bacterium]